MVFGVGLHSLFPALLALGASLPGVPAGVDIVRDLERLIGPVEGDAGRGHLVRPQRRAVAGFTALLVGRALANHGLAADERGPGGLVARRLYGGLHFRGAVAIDVVDHLPAIGLEARRGVIGEPTLHLAVDGDAVVIVEHHQFAQAQGARQGTDLVGDTLHQAAVAHKGIGVVVHHLVPLAVELGRQYFFRQRHAHGIGQTLAQGAGGGLDAGGVAVFGVARGLAVQLAEVLQLLDRQLVTGEVQQGVQQHRAVAVGQHETVAVGPLGVGRVVSQVVIPQDFRDIGHAHGGSRVTTIGLLDGVHAQGADGIG